MDERAASGQPMHGEVEFLERWSPATVLDAGCGTGRVAIEAHRRGVDVVGVDVDPSMLDTARSLGPDVEWVQADLTTLDLDRRFRVVIMAGNVPLFTPPRTEAALVGAVATHVADDGVLIAGFSTDWERRYSAEQYDEHCAAAGLTLVERFSTWDREPWTAQSTYAVSVHGRATGR